MQQFSCVPLAVLVIAALAWALDVKAADNVEPRAVACVWIKDVTQLQAMRNNLAGTYCLANDIDASSKANFVPVGTSAAAFTGKFFGNGHVITDLTVNSSADYASVGLFGSTSGTIQDVGLINATVTGTGYQANVGGLVGQGGTLLRVHVTGQVRCTKPFCTTGGIAGSVGTLSESWSSAKVTGGGGGSYSYTGGAAGFVGYVDRTHATGPVTCGSSCIAGGLAGKVAFSAILSYATGPVTAGDSSMVGGLAGQTQGSAAIKRSYATGAVATGAQSRAGGLVGQLPEGATVEEGAYATGAVTGGGESLVGGLIGELGGIVDRAYAVGPVSGGPLSTVGGLVGQRAGFGAFDSYWDSDTTGQATSAAGTPQTTAQLRADLPAGFGNAWAITKPLSYPFLNEFDIDFASPLATLVRSKRVFTFLPIGQADESQYLTAPENAEQAALATVYTMIARAVGITRNVAQLKGVKIDRYFWDDAAQTTTWTGPVTTYAALGTLTAVVGSEQLNGANVIGPMKQQRLVILRGVYRKSDGSPAAHWMLGTLYTRNPDGSVSAVVAHDPWTAQQVTIDPATKRVLSPADFPLANLRINGYQTVTVK